MKIVVDELPKKESDCLFSKYNQDGYHTCQINKEGPLTNCTLCTTGCDKLIEYKKIEKRKSINHLYI